MHRDDKKDVCPPQDEMASFLASDHKSDFNCDRSEFLARNIAGELQKINPMRALRP